MTLFWEPGTQYNLGDVVEYEGHKYKIVQPHTSQVGDWAPPVTPALWARVHEEYPEEKHDHHEEKHHDRYQDEKRDEYHNQAQAPISLPPSGGPPPHATEEEKRHWYDMTPERKKQFEIGGGILAGAALLGGGLYAYKQHEKKEKEKEGRERDVLTEKDWHDDAQDRTQRFNQEGHAPGQPFTWVLVNGKNIPPGAMPGGEEAGQPLYIARGHINESLQLGKASSRFERGALFGYGGNEIPQDKYEVLVGDQNAVKWVKCTGRFDPNEFHRHGDKPIEAGHDSDGSILYIIQARDEHGGVHPGKVSSHMQGGMISYGGGERAFEEYFVLCYKH
ncbi:hypothetical protein EIP91_010773 [Steccherinum ochraceum]|uniref:Chitin-binding type-3 domain-containing protein n=1 Tax=Steccherinum ochraceum TaxID=92696 RepID=A0A4R0R841_9APHY|nr:hypothetical protein EIP91_010773 [Steccherinum ochraceum]